MKTLILILCTTVAFAQPKSQWGMTMDQVKAAEGHHHRYRSGELDSLAYFHYHTTFNDFKCDMVFFFLDDSLVAVDVIFSEKFHHHHYQDRFQVMEEALKRDYGPATHADSVMVTDRQLTDTTIQHALMMDPSNFTFRHRPIHSHITHIVQFKQRRYAL